MTPAKEPSTTQQEVLEAILATVESIDRNVEEILDHLADHVADMRYGGAADGHFMDDSDLA